MKWIWLYSTGYALVILKPLSIITNLQVGSLGSVLTVLLLALIFSLLSSLCLKLLVTRYTTMTQQCGSTRESVNSSVHVTQHMR